MSDPRIQSLHTSPHPTIAIVGATGAVGRELLAILSDRAVPQSHIRALASERSAGASLPYGGASVRIEPLNTGSFAGIRAAIFATDAPISREYIPIARAAGAIVIDNSSAFRLDAGVPLIVPEVNGHLLREVPTLIANPNCSAAILLVAIEPLRRAFGVKHLHVATYQAVSGAGIAAMDELREQARATLAGDTYTPKVFHEPCAFNVFSHDSAMDIASGLNGEERKLIDECRKITGLSALPISPTCVRVPVMRAHTQAITVELIEPATFEQVRNVYAVAHNDTARSGLQVIDDRANNRFPTPLKAAGKDPVLVGRLRPDPGAASTSDSRCTSICLLASGDQLRKGAALNAIQIAETLSLLPHSVP